MHRIVWLSMSISVRRLMANPRRGSEFVDQFLYRLLAVTNNVQALAATAIRRLFTTKARKSAPTSLRRSPNANTPWPSPNACFLDRLHTDRSTFAVAAVQRFDDDRKADASSVFPVFFVTDPITLVPERPYRGSVLVACLFPAISTAIMFVFAVVVA